MCYTFDITLKMSVNVYHVLHCKIFTLGLTNFGSSLYLFVCFDISFDVTASSKTNETANKYLAKFSTSDRT